ncbi:hypothetical protein RP20_CCG005279 [Aedes albopictus]|nr:hypothetical protein RP20_CCG005279 [Aedes albopictus]
MAQLHLADDQLMILFEGKKCIRETRLDPFVGWSIPSCSCHAVKEIQGEGDHSQ